MSLGRARGAAGGGAIYPLREARAETTAACHASTRGIRIQEAAARWWQSAPSERTCRPAAEAAHGGRAADAEKGEADALRPTVSEGVDELHAKLRREVSLGPSVTEKVPEMAKRVLRCGRRHIQWWLH